MAEKMKLYAALRTTFLIERPRCAVCGLRSRDVHHMKGRAKFLLERSTWMAVCRICHDYIETHKRWAREKGYILYA